MHGEPRNPTYVASLEITGGFIGKPVRKIQLKFIYNPPQGEGGRWVLMPGGGREV
jgi:hypothetical protein